MTLRLKIEDADGASARALEFPVALGGPASGLPELGVPVGWLGLDGSEVFVQPVDPPADLACNGIPLSASRWLRDGDVLRAGPLRLTFRSGPGGPTLRIARDPGGLVTPSPFLPHSAPVAPAALIRPVEFRPRALTPPARPRSWRPTTTHFVMLALVLLVALGAFVLSGRAVEVRIEPAPDAMAVRGGLLNLPLGGRYLLRPGPHTVSASKAGHRPLEASFEVTDAAAQSFSFRLELLPGRLAIDTGGVAGARVEVDGRQVGATPLAAIELAAGEHAVAIQAEGYAPFSARTNVRGAGELDTLKAALVPDRAAVSFDSEPRGAVVHVDGRAVGTTPLTVDLSAGSREVRWALAGYRGASRTIEVIANEPLQVPLVRLSVAAGRLKLASEPTGASVAVDGAFRGRTPLELELAPDRDHALKLSLQAHEPATLGMRLGRGEERSETVTLKPLLGEVTLDVRPPDAEVLVNGTPQGRSGETLRLPASPQEFEIRREGYAPHRATLTPRPGFPQALRVTLTATGPLAEAAKPAQVRGAGHELKLVTGARFTMGASRREPGRRANEVQRDVEITRPFYIGLEEVTNGEFRRFRANHSSGAVDRYSLDTDDLPVVRVTWEDAALYCNWLSQQEGRAPAYVRKGGGLVAATPATNGYRLPTEAEWTRAARYPQGPTALKYPWGPALPVAARSGNYADESARALLPAVIAGYDDGAPATVPPGRFAPNPLGLFDLGGNVAEWVHDVYAIPAEGGLERDPTGPAEGALHVIKGSSFMHATVTELRTSFRDYSATARPDVGFRVARPAE
ncbi:MAG: SUMF1/EgtB/PvdO family nonheme iron enzyme [Vicinamibacteria bacterium]|nr:SUMF1/EgtB/PvdO family nonheme iron enzyme [Vicinamibacteria bacterium]